MTTATPADPDPRGEDDPDAGDIEDIYALSPLQLGMLLQTQLAPGSGVFFQQVATTLPSRVDPVAFGSAWQDLVDATPALRTSFHWRGLDNPVQVVHRRVALDLVRLDWTRVPPRAVPARLDAHLAEARARGFELDRPPLLRVDLVELPGGSQGFVWHFHHLLLDGWSSQLVLDELLRRYTATLRGEPADVPARPPFSTYIAWLQRQDHAAAERHWRSVLADVHHATPLRLATDGGRGAGAAPRAGGADGNGADRPADLTEHVAELPRTATEALLRFARSNRVTLSTVVQGAWALVLSRYSGERDVVFGSVVSGRPADLPGVESIVGLFINSIPVRVRAEPDRPLADWLRHLQGDQARAQQFDHVSPMQLSQWSGLPAGARLYDSLVVVENFPMALSEAPGGEGRTVDVGQTDLPLVLMVTPGETLRLTLRADPRVVDPAALRRLAGHLTTLLERFPDAAAAPVSAVPMLPDAEVARLVRAARGPSASPSRSAPERDVAELFAEAVGRGPDAVALVGPDGVTATYRWLDDRSAALAARLAGAGVGRGDVVGVHLARSTDLVATLLAVLRLGAVYLPLDPAHPPARLHRMVERSGARLVVTATAGSAPAGAAVLDLGGTPTVAAPGRPHPVPHPVPQPIPQPNPQPDSQLDSQPAPDRAAPDDPAYVLFTSGSTGTPKGVVGAHRTLLNRLAWMWRVHPFAPGEVSVARTSIGFVDSLWELLGPLLAGSPTLLAPDDDVADPRALVDLAGRHGVTRVFLVPSYLEALLDRCPDVATRAPALRTWFSGGEPLTAELCRRFRDALPGAALHNLYGSTELWDVTAADAVAESPQRGRVTVGRPIDDVAAHVLDLDGHPSPVGVTGTLHVGGAALPLRLLDDGEQRRLVLRDLDGVPTRLFDTGDLARVLDDGRIDVVGRADAQLKVRGFRVEPAEVEAALERHPHVAAAVVAPAPPGTADDRLVAVAVPAVTAPDEADVRSWAASLLLPAMVPARIVWGDALPRTTSGKKDRSAVAGLVAAAAPAPAPGAGGPEDDLERAVAAAYADVLEVPAVGRDDHFFADLGGHSLLAVRVCSRLSGALGVDVPLRDVFDHPTVALLAARLRPTVSGPAAGPTTGPLDEDAILAQLEGLSDEEVEAILAGLDDLPAEVERD